MLNHAIVPIELPAALRPGARPAPAHSLAAVFRAIGGPMTFARDEEIFGAEEEAEFFYEVATGAVRSYQVLADGRRQIAAFHLPGDIFGIEAGCRHGFSADAIGDSVVRVARRSAVLAMPSRDPELASDLWMRTAEALSAAQEHMLLLGRKTAEEKVMTFLLHLSKRASSGAMVELPMSRQDIADHLGLTIETVSRTLTQLEGRQVIALPACRRILLCGGPGWARAA